MSVEQEYVVRRVCTDTIYKLLFLGMLISCIPIGLILGIAAYFGADTVIFDHQYLHGLAGLLAGPVIVVLLGLFLAALVGTLTCFGLWLRSLVGVMIIRVVFDT